MSDHNFARDPERVDSRNARSPITASVPPPGAISPRCAPCNRPGPYVLGGYSYGGLVAFEMACRLRAAGEEVELLVDPRHERADRRAQRHEPRPRRAARHSGPSAVFRSAEARRDCRRARRAVRGASRPTRTPSDGSRSRAWAWCPVAATTSTTCSCGCNARMATRVSSRRASSTARCSSSRGDVLRRPPSRRRRETRPGSPGAARPRVVQLVTGPITVAEVPGDHQGIMRQPTVDQVAAHMRARRSADSAAPDGGTRWMIRSSGRRSSTSTSGATHRCGTATSTVASRAPTPGSPSTSHPRNSGRAGCSRHSKAATAVTRTPRRVASGTMGGIAFAVASGCYLVESNQGHFGDDMWILLSEPTVGAYRASAQSARVLAG